MIQNIAFYYWLFWTFRRNSLSIRTYVNVRQLLASGDKKRWAMQHTWKVRFLPKNQPLLDYFWELSINWERLQKWQLCMGDWIKALIKKIDFCAFCLFVCISLYGVHYLFQLALYDIVRCPLLISSGSVLSLCIILYIVHLFVIDFSFRNTCLSFELSRWRMFWTSGIL